MATEREYLSSATLMILGKTLDPKVISKSLSKSLCMRPNQAWEKGEEKHFGSSIHHYQWGGWKKFLPPSLKSKSLESQILYWLRTLRPHKAAITKIGRDQDLVALDCLVITEETASIILPPAILKTVSDLGFDVRLSVSIYENHDGSS